MNRMLAIIGLVAVSALAAHAQNAIEVGPRDEPPKIRPGGEPKPVVRPTDGRQVAVLNIRLTLDQGKVRGAEVVESRRIDSIAPKVFRRQGGDWEVRINGSAEDAFFVFSPAYLEAETGEGARNPYTYVPRNGVVDWPLVVPLYRGSRTIRAESILVVDRRTGERVMEASLEPK